MTVKSIIDVEINDSAFKEFAELFAKYKAALGETPGMWASANEAASGAASSASEIGAALLAANTVNGKLVREEEAKARALEKQQRILRGFAPTYKEVASSVANIVKSLAKWAAYSGVAGGLLGYGGLLGLDRLALGVGYDRRRAQGLGTSIGEEKAFGNAYGRLVDPGAFLGGVGESLTDVTKRPALFGAGLSKEDINGRKTADVADALLVKLKGIADRTPTALLAQQSTARGLNQFVSVEDLRRLKATTPEEFSSIRAKYRAGSTNFNLEDDVARRWQDLGVQLDAAKIKIEAVFVRGLAPLTKPLEQLSDAVANAVQNFLQGVDPATIKDIGKGIEDFGKYLGSPAFRTDVKNFADDVSYAAKKIGSVLRWLGVLPDREQQARDEAVSEGLKSGKITTLAEYQKAKNAPSDPNAEPWWNPGSWVDRKGGVKEKLETLGGVKKVLGVKAAWFPRPNDTNPGNIRMPGRPTGFAYFESADDGIRAMERQLKLYIDRDHLDTIHKIIGKYAPAKDKNDVKAYEADVVKYTGIKGDEKIDSKDTTMLSKIIAGMTKHEGRKPYSAKQVDVVIRNDTGGSAVVQSSQAAKQG